MDRTLIIAEAGVNHNGELALAKELIDAAAEAGADAVKFQSFKAETLVLRDAPKAAYQKQATGEAESQFEMIKSLELGCQDHLELLERCRQRQIMFLSSPFDRESIALLNDLGLDIFKVPSGEITNLPYLRNIGKLGKRVILSTGMADIDEIDAALQVLSAAGTPLSRITLLHCNTEYPTPMEDVNLLAMLSLRKRFQLPVGYSDHTLGIEIPIAAVGLGAAVIEKHFTLDRTLPGPDHKASLEPEELAAMVRAIRNIERALGDGIKRPSRSEEKNRAIARRSIVAARVIKQGETLTEQNLTTKRPGTGLNPMEWDKVLGSLAIRDFQPDEPITMT